MTKNLKPRKCKECRKEFAPKTEWQKYCSGLCKGRVGNRRKAKLLKQAQRIIEAQERGAA